MAMRNVRSIAGAASRAAAKNGRRDAGARQTVTPGSSPAARGFRKLTTVGLALGWQLAALCLPTAQAPPSFAAVSIKAVTASMGDGRWALRTDPAGVHAAALSLASLIGYAYGIEPYQILGGEKWMQTERFDVDATTEGPATTAEEMIMLRQALASRFGGGDAFSGDPS